MQVIQGNMGPLGERSQLIGGKESMLPLNCPEFFKNHYYKPILPPQGLIELENG